VTQSDLARAVGYSSIAYVYLRKATSNEPSKPRRRRDSIERVSLELFGDRAGAKGRLEGGEVEGKAFREFAKSSEGSKTRSEKL
jgi:hypothetical protein